jgi:hypothetical protein
VDDQLVSDIVDAILTHREAAERRDGLYVTAAAGASYNKIEQAVRAELLNRRSELERLGVTDLDGLGVGRDNIRRVVNARRVATV